MTRCLFLLGAVTAVGACSGDGSYRPLDAGVSEPANPGEAGADVTRTGKPDAATATATDAFWVRLTASKVDLCSGECADLSVTTGNASGPVAYSWSDGLPTEATQHVCPTETHTYQIEATASISGEVRFEQMASDGLTVSVRDCSMPATADDDGVLCEARQRLDYPLNRDIANASQPWASVGTYYSGRSAIEEAPDGGAYVVGSFGTELDLGAGRVTANAQTSAFLHRLDTNCMPMKTLVLSATNPSDSILPAALAVDEQGNAYVASVAGPPLGGSSSTTMRWITELLVEKFSAAGQSLWRYRAGTLGGIIGAMEVNAAGEVFVSGLVSETSDLGSGSPIGLSITAYHTFGLKLGADGRFAAQRIDTGAAQLALAGDHCVDVTSSTGSFDVLAPFQPSMPMGAPTYYVTGSEESDLTVLWRTPYEYNTDNMPSALTGTTSGVFAAIFDAQLMPDPVTFRQGSIVRRYGPDGGVQSQTEFIARTPSDLFSFTYMSESEPASLAIAGTAPDAVVLKLDAHDQTRWKRSQDYGPSTTLSGIASSPSGEVWVSGLARVEGSPADATFLEYDLVIRKLRAN